MVRRVLFFLMMVVFLPVPARSESSSPVRILLLGDSTTEGSIPRILKPEGPHLDQTLKHILESGGVSCEVIASGKSGETIRGLIDQGRYQRDVAKLSPQDFIFVRYGINDEAQGGDFTETFFKDLRELIGLLRKDHPRALIIPTTVIPFLSEASSKKINDVIQKVGATEGLQVFDLYPGYAAALAKGPNMLNYRRYPPRKNSAAAPRVAQVACA